MMFVTVENFLADYKNEAVLTKKLLDALTDDSLKQETAPGYRTLGELAWHLVPNDSMFKPMGLSIKNPESIEVPARASDIAEQYRTGADSVIEAVSKWDDEKLQETNEVFGYEWQNGLTLSLFLKHEIHHRGQLTVLMRQAGLPVYGAYGPSKEEWAGMNIPSL